MRLSSIVIFALAAVVLAGSANTVQAQVKIGVVGCGVVATAYYLPYLLDDPRAEITAVCDIYPTRTEACARLFGAREQYSDYDEMIENIDIGGPAMIRAARDWGEVDGQGRAYGILDAGRGGLAAGIALPGCSPKAAELPAEGELADVEGGDDVDDIGRHGIQVLDEVVSESYITETELSPDQSLYFVRHRFHSSSFHPYGLRSIDSISSATLSAAARSRSQSR